MDALRGAIRAAQAARRQGRVLDGLVHGRAQGVGGTLGLSVLSVSVRVSANVGVSGVTACAGVAHGRRRQRRRTVDAGGRGRARASHQLLGLAAGRGAERERAGGPSARQLRDATGARV